MSSRYLILPDEAQAGARLHLSGWTPAILGILGGALTVIALRLPLISLPSLGQVGYFDYSALRAKASLVLAILAALLSLVRCYRLSLLASGLLCGLFLATSLDVSQALRELMTGPNANPALSQMVKQIIWGSNLKIGAFVLATGCILSVASAFTGLNTRPRRRRGFVNSPDLS